MTSLCFVEKREYLVIHLLFVVQVEEGVGAENLLGESLQQQDGCEKDTNELYGVES